MRRTLPIIIGIVILAVIALLTIHAGKFVASAEVDHEGYVLAHQKRYAEAIVKCRRAVQLDEDNSMAHNNLGYYLYKNGQMQEAETECREALRLRSNYAEVHDSLGAVLAHTGRLPEALQECQEAVRLKPSGSHYNTLGYVLYEQGQKEQARQLWQKVAVMNDPEAAAEARQYLTQYR